MTNIKTIIDNNSNDLAFIVGNGINRYSNDHKGTSWDDLLIGLWREFSFSTISEIPKGISLTEFYDLLEIETATSSATNPNIQEQVSSLLKSWNCKSHHKCFLEKAKALNIPILTTNFDLILPNTLNLKKFNTSNNGFTDYYPWMTHYSDKKLSDPTKGFGIWFINGFIKYHRSIRLGLTQYMGSVEKARKMLYNGRGRRLSSCNNPNEWSGDKTWLHIIFNKSLCVLGLGLEENEVFLRWLLIERAKYFRKFPERKKQGWYITIKPSTINEVYKGKKFFLEKIGFEVIEVDNYDDIYITPWK